MDNKTTKEKLKRAYFPLELLQQEWSNPSLVLVYSLMLNRYNFFLSKSTDKTKEIYFESQEEIAKLLNISEKTVNRSITTLKEKGLITVKLIRRGTSFKNSYTVSDVYNMLPIQDKHSKPVKNNVPVKTIKPTQEGEDQPSWA